MDARKLHDLIDELPAPLQEQVFDFVSSLLTAEQRGSPPQARVAGLHAGAVWVRSDFDDPLPDAFWLGEG